jgi:4-diphosphocytidyl-2C-methyl-D-erythritol kinase
MITFPNAKINLGLSVVGKRPDGYHNLETVFYPVGLSDALEVVTAPLSNDCTLRVSGMQVDGETADNLVVKAYRELQKHFDLPGIEVDLYKKIPFGAGLGGGSSDAAFMLSMLRRMFKLPLSDAQMEEIATRLGADCAFFCRNVPIYAEGIGDQFTPVSLSLKNYSLVIVKPAFGVSTKVAFSGISPRSAQINVRRIVEDYPVEQWQELLMNDFETTVFKAYPVLEEIKN